MARKINHLSDACDTPKILSRMFGRDELIELNFCTFRDAHNNECKRLQVGNNAYVPNRLRTLHPKR